MTPKEMNLPCQLTSINLFLITIFLRIISGSTTFIKAINHLDTAKWVRHTAEKGSCEKGQIFRIFEVIGQPQANA